MITIFVVGGVVQEVYGCEDYRIVDLDCLESGECPNSGCGELIDEEDYCSECNIRWDEYLNWKETHEKLEANDKPIKDIGDHIREAEENEL